MSASSAFKLFYFKMHGRALPIRLAAAIGQVAYEDVYIAREEWAAVKPKTPGGTLPYIEVAGKALGQSNACLLFAGHLGGLVPSSPWQLAVVEEVLSTVEDAYTQFGPSFSEADPEKKLALRRELADKKLPPVFASLQSVLAREGHPFFADERLTVADLKVFGLLWWLKSGLLDGIPTTIFDGYPGLLALYNTINDLPAVQSYFANFGK